MNITRFSLKHPYIIIALALLTTALGGFAFFRTPTDLFPDTVPPQVVVVTVEPGAAAADVSDNITQIIEKELNTISGLKTIRSTSRDEVSSINAEFFYYKSIGEAVIDTQNALSRVRAALPKDILEPRIYRVTDATRALTTIAMSPKPGSAKSLMDIRLLAENQIEDEILNLPGIADVDIFGANQPEVRVHVRRDRLAANGISLGELMAALSRQNVSAPAGHIYSTNSEYLVKVEGRFDNLQQIRNLPLRQSGHGYLKVSDVATVELVPARPHSIYHGNGKPAIGLNVMRPDNGPTVSAIKAFKAFLPKLRAQFPDVNFEIADDQQPIIDINVHGMRDSLLQATILTIIIIFIFLADVRAAIVSSVSIPLSFLISLVVLWFSPYTLNMVTLSGLIIAVGMVVGASVVVLENIHRLYAAEEHPDALAIAQKGSDEVFLAITAGVLTTVIVLIPVMFTGGYTQRLMRPLNLMISSTLFGSLLVALTIIPLMAAWLFKGPKRERNLIERIMLYSDKGMAAMASFYLVLLRWGMRWRITALVIAAVFLAATMRIVPPLIGGELMPPMDTGISIIYFDTPTDYSPARVEHVLDRVEKMIYEQPGVEMVSSVVGSEPGEISFGGGGATTQSGKIIVHMVDRTHRSKTIWQIDSHWRTQLRQMPGIRTYAVTEYGATPLSTTKAPLDIIASGPDPHILSRLADDCLAALKGMPGLVDVRRSWYFDKTEKQIIVDPELARLYGTSPAQAAEDLKVAVKGVAPTMMRLKGFLDVPIKVQYANEDLHSPRQLEQAYVATLYGPMPLRAFATVETKHDQPFVTRERLQDTIDITGINTVYTIQQVAKMAKKRLNNIKTPEGYVIDVSGTNADMEVGNKEMSGALIIGLVLLYFLIMGMFNSFRHPVTIMLSIPLAVAGALWGLLLFDKPMCKPAFMGLILLGGTIVNNSILLLDYIIEARKRGIPQDEAIVESVRVRIRPIMMTTLATIIGLTPLILELAVGMERMSPLAIVAATGLAIGTLVTMVITPIIYSVVESLIGYARGIFAS